VLGEGEKIRTRTFGCHEVAYKEALSCFVQYQFIPPLKRGISAAPLS